MHADAAAPTLTLGDFVRLREEIEADMNLLALLPGRIAQKKKLYDAALQYVQANVGITVAPDGGRTSSAVTRPPETQPKPKGDQDSLGKLTWIGQTRRIINAADHGLSYAEILAELKALPLAPSVGDKGFYNAVIRLEAKSEIVKASGLVYSARLAQQKGLTPRAHSKADGNLGGTSGITLAVIQAHPAGIKAADIKGELQRRADCPESMKKHGHYIYSVLSKLMDSGAITKDSNGVYRAV